MTDAPHSIEMEQAIIGACLVSPDTMDAAMALVSQHHFYDPVHARIWGHMVTRAKAQHLASPVTIKVAMEGDDGLKELGGPAYLARLAGAAMGHVTCLKLCDDLVRLAARRDMLAQLQGVADKIKAGASADEAAADLEIALFNREQTSDAPRSVSLLAATTQALTAMNDMNRGISPAGITTGLKALDDMVSLKPGRYTIIGAATSMGKSALAIWIAHAAAKSGVGVGFASLEMPVTDVANRINSIGSQIPYRAYDRTTSETSFRRIAQVASENQALPIQIFDASARDVPAIMAEMQKIKRFWKPNGQFQGGKLLIVDYLQLVRGKGESQFVRLSEVANAFKTVAKMLDVHVIALAQVDRKIGDRDDTRPNLSDLRGSGDLEFAPDTVMFLHRPEYYLSRKTPPKKPEDRADFEAELSRWKGKAEIIVAKSRMGEIGSVTVGCDMATNRFWDLEATQDMEF